jgi:hypothetical protein
MTEQRRGYLAYLLRLWQVHSDGKSTWRASLESARTGEHRGFANLKDLFTFLEREVGRVAQDQTGSRVRGKGGDIEK